MVKGEEGGKKGILALASELGFRYRYLFLCICLFVGFF